MNQVHAIKHLVISYEQLEVLASDTRTPNELSNQYSSLLNRLSSYMPNEEFRRNEINTNGLLWLQQDGRAVYSEVSPYWMKMANGPSLP